MCVSLCFVCVCCFSYVYVCVFCVFVLSVCVCVCVLGVEDAWLVANVLILLLLLYRKRQWRCNSFSSAIEDNLLRTVLVI